MEHHDKLTSALEEGHNLFVVYLDFAKAYDLVDLLVLLMKAKNTGIEGKLLIWLWEFWRNREQRVKVENWLSAPKEITTGVP